MKVCFNMAKKKLLLNSVSAIGAIGVPYNPGGWKMDGDSLTLQDGNPVYVDSNGQERTLDAGTVSRLNGEARTMRQRAEAAENALKSFEGLDAAAAREALKKLETVDLNNMVDNGELDKVRNTLTQQYEAQLSERDGKLEAATKRINKMMLENAFNSSDFIRNNIGIPTDVFQDYIAKHFEVDGDRIVGRYADGQEIYSETNMGQLASFDEAVRMIVTKHPQRESLMKANVNPGSGNSGGNTPGTRTISRADFDNLAPAEKSATAKLMREGKVRLV